jgi:enoyl-CoA hydratase
VAGDGGALLWPQLIGINRAKEYLFTGEPLLASDAARLGLINHAVPASELDARVRDFAHRVAGQPTRAVQGTKTTINLGVRALAQSVMDAGMAFETITSRTDDHREAVMAMIEKRKPKFSGS